MRKTQSLLLLLCLLVFGAFSCANYRTETFPKVELFPVKVNDQKGYINKSGEIVIKPQFDDAGFFSNGLAKVSIGKKYGFIKGNGEFVVKPQFDDAQRFSEGLAAVKNGNSWGFINTSGEMVVTPRFDSRSNNSSNTGLLIFSDGLAEACSSYDKCGFIDKTGEFKIQPKFVFASPFFDGVAIVLEEESNGNYTTSLINKSGEYIGKRQNNLMPSGGFESLIIHFNNLEGITLSFPIPVKAMDRKKNGGSIQESSGKTGFMDKEGNFVINPQYEDGGMFSDGLAPVEIDNKWGFINNKGQVIITPQFTEAGWFSEGLAPVMIGDNSLSPSQIENPSPETMKDRINPQWGFIDKTGKMVINPQYDRVEVLFTNGLAAVHQGNSVGWITPTGKFVKQFTK